MPIVLGVPTSTVVSLPVFVETNPGPTARISGKGTASIGCTRVRLAEVITVTKLVHFNRSITVEKVMIRKNKIEF